MSALRRDRTLDVVGEGSSAADAVNMARDHLPDVVLLDLNMPGGGLNAVREIATAAPVTRIIVLTVSEDDDDVVAALQAGARGYVLKGVGSTELIGVIKSVAAGEVYVTPALASGLLVGLTRGSTGASEQSNPLDELSDRERQILERVAQGDSNKEIAFDLALSEKTVKHYMTNILQKLQVRNRVEAALLAHKASLSDS